MRAARGRSAAAVLRSPPARGHRMKHGRDRREPEDAAKAAGWPKRPLGSQKRPFGSLQRALGSRAMALDRRRGRLDHRLRRPGRPNHARERQPERLRRGARRRGPSLAAGGGGGAGFGARFFTARRADVRLIVAFVAPGAHPRRRRSFAAPALMLARSAALPPVAPLRSPSVLRWLASASASAARSFPSLSIRALLNPAAFTSFARAANEPAR